MQPDAPQFTPTQYPQQQYEQQYAPPQQFQQGPYQQPQYGPPQQFGAPNAWPIHRIMATVVAPLGILAVIASMFALYSVTVNPSEMDGGESVNGKVEISLGFYDSIPFNAPSLALVVPVLLLLAGLSAVPTIVDPRSRLAGLPALFAVSGTLFALVLIITNPLPSIEVTGEIAEGLEDEIGRNPDDLVGEVLNISPGIGLILVLGLGVLISGGAVTQWLTANKAQGPTPGNF